VHVATLQKLTASIVKTFSQPGRMQCIRRVSVAIWFSSKRRANCSATAEPAKRRTSVSVTAQRHFASMQRTECPPPLVRVVMALVQQSLQK
jgi:hypothetical protein